MLGIGWAELLVIAVVALVVVGPEKLPEAARSCGKIYGQFHRLLSEAKSSLQSEIDLAGLEDADKPESPKDGESDAAGSGK